MRAMLRSIRELSGAYARNVQGAAAVEFAIIAMAFILSVFGVIEAGRIFWTWNTLQYAGESAARYYLTHSSASDSDLREYIEDRLEDAMLDGESMAVTITKPTVSSVDFLQLDLSYEYGVLGNLMPAGLDEITLTTTTRLPVP